MAPVDIVTLVARVPKEEAAAAFDWNMEEAAPTPGPLFNMWLPSGIRKPDARFNPTSSQGQQNIGKR